MGRSKNSVMNPGPGQVYVQFRKETPVITEETHEEDLELLDEEGILLDAGVDVMLKPGYGNRVYLSRAEAPSSPTLNVGDRLVALNGKSIESFGGNLDEIRKVFQTKKTIKMVVDPTLIK